MKSLCVALALAALPAALATPAPAEMSHDQHMAHMARQMGITEPGQSAFGAIAEIVARLEADPATDWSRVDIDALRAHLVDMDRVTLWSRVETQPAETGARFTVTGEGDTVAAIRRMTHAHAAMMEGQWHFDVHDIENGAAVEVTVPAGDLPRLRGLGFFGLMASGMHHQMHHWMLATGADPH
ncbi:MAG: hypothetical protein R3D85_16090 [Paracoccaceae bacterium]